MMSEKRLRYSILKYSSSFISGKTVNLGVLFYSGDEQITKFYATKKASRIRIFCDDVDPQMVNLLLSSISRKADTTFDTLDKPFDFDSFIRDYSSEFYFSEAMTCPYSDFTQCVDEILRMYLPEDFDKDKRPTHGEELKFLAKIMSAQRISYKRNSKQIGIFNDRITYDFVAGKYAIKVFQLNHKDLRKIVNDAKAWAWNCQNQPQSLETVIIYSYEGKKSPISDTVIQILKASSKYVFPWTEGLEWLQKSIPSKYVES
jgi:hypothetical protein